MIIWLVIEGVLFTIAGLFFIFKPNLYLRLVKWQISRILKAKLVTTDETIKRMNIISRAVGALLAFVGLSILYSHLILGIS